MRSRRSSPAIPGGCRRGSPDPGGNDEDERARLVAEAIAVVDASTPFGEVMHLGLLLRTEGFWEQLLDLMRDRVTLERDSDRPASDDRGVVEVDDRAGLVTVFDVMPPAVADLDPYLRYRLAIFFNVGDLATARVAADRLVERHPYDLARRMDWLRVVMRQDDRNSVSAWLAGPVEDLRGEPAARADLALVLANNGLDVRARTLAYRLARRYPVDQHVQERFLASCSRLAARVPPSSHSPGRPDAVFVSVTPGARGRSASRRRRTCRSNLSTCRRSTRRSRGRRRPWRRADSYMLPPTLEGAAPATFEIREVKHKHLHLMHESMATLNERFPGSSMFRAVSVDPVSGAGMEVLLAQVTRREQQVERAFAHYHASGMPLRTLPMVLGGDVIDAYDGLREAGARFLATAGEPAARTREAAIIRRAGRRGALSENALTLRARQAPRDGRRYRRRAGQDLHHAAPAVDVFSHRVTEMGAMPGRFAGTSSTNCTAASSRELTSHLSR